MVCLRLHTLLRNHPPCRDSIVVIHGAGGSGMIRFPLPASASHENQAHEKKINNQHLLRMHNRCQFTTVLNAMFDTYSVVLYDSRYVMRRREQNQHRFLTPPLNPKPHALGMVCDGRAPSSNRRRFEQTIACCVLVRTSQDVDIMLTPPSRYPPTSMLSYWTMCARVFEGWLYAVVLSNPWNMQESKYIFSPPENNRGWLGPWHHSSSIL